MKDELFKKQQTKLSEFEFNGDVAQVFDDMVDRSIPFYASVQDMQIDFLEHFQQPEGCFYDLGCSTASLIARIQSDNRISFRELIGIDGSSAMLEKAQSRLVQAPQRLAWRLSCADLKTCQFSDAAAVVLDYTLQFVRPLYRPTLLAQIYRDLRPGGVLLLSEKVLEETGFMSRLFQEMYLQFKRRKGYSDLEIAQKRDKLEHVLVPYKVSEQIELLKHAGFEHVEMFFKWHNFASFIAVKAL
ncbi:MAG: carboxy-S-adenosyl-L-methionine synthase CmoA [Acidobacteria bacterium]|nr:carboxy-S-adenosyl-L-methionine synthase CmoA [Acidobacteriota bacterium]MCB9398880.1 carboxy-S-adenosyl-L-methionine synthase CmoA [Acidobacteriota bacterium]